MKKNESVKKRTSHASPKTRPKKSSKATEPVSALEEAETGSEDLPEKRKTKGRK